MALSKKTNLIASVLFITISYNLFSQGLNKNDAFRIDAHIHLYDTNREGSCIFLDPLKHKKIYYPHLVPEFLEVAAPAGVNHAVVVEASKRREDNYWVMDIVNKSDNMLAFIGNLDPRDPHYIDDLIKLSENKKFRGIRIRPKKAIDFSDKKVIQLLGELAKRDLVLELGEHAGPLGAIEKISRKYPEMNIIIDHMAGGRIQNNQIVPKSWNKRLKQLAALPNIYVKISMLYELSGQTPAPTDYKFYKTFMDQVIDTFGPNRVLYGSNWTLSEMCGSYANLIKFSDAYINEKEIITTQQFYTSNVIKAYGLK
jgi:predicted TIM-barrel fold metal-dependent hydrolase